MKSLPLQSPYYQRLQQDFQHWLTILGYSPSIIYGLPYYLQEFLHYLERLPAGRHGIQTCWHETPVNDYLEYLKSRKNTRRTGGLSNHSINNHIYMLSRFSEYLFKVHGQTLPVTLSPLATPDQPEFILSKTSIDMLYEATEESPLGSRDRAMLSIFYGCGLRRSEGERLDITDILPDRKAVWIRKSKNGKSRMVPVSSGVSDHISEYLSYGRPQLQDNPTEQAFFLNRRGDRIQGGNLYVRLKKLLEVSGLIEHHPEAGLHTLRHSIATHLMESGMKIEDVSRFLGHSSLESTQKYTHLCAALNK